MASGQTRREKKKEVYPAVLPERLYIERPSRGQRGTWMSPPKKETKKKKSSGAGINTSTAAIVILFFSCGIPLLHVDAYRSRCLRQAPPRRLPITTQKRLFFSPSGCLTESQHPRGLLAFYHQTKSQLYHRIYRYIRFLFSPPRGICGEDEAERQRVRETCIQHEREMSSSCARSLSLAILLLLPAESKIYSAGSVALAVVQKEARQGVRNRNRANNRITRRR